MRTIQEDFGVNEVKRFVVGGSRYFRLLTTSYPLDIEFHRDNQNLGQKSLQVESGYYAEPGGGFDEVLITNGAAAQTVKLAVATGKGGYDRISGTVSIAGTVGVSGSVSVIDGGKALTLTNNAFLANVALGAVAAQYAHAQIWNPAASGKQTIVKSVAIRSGTGGGITGRFHNAQLANGYLGVASKLEGGALPSTLGRTENSVALLGSGAVFFGCAIQANTTYLHKFDEPLIFGAGRGLLLEHGVVNTDLGVLFDFREE